MTLIQAMATPAYVLQVSDRLVSRRYEYRSGRRLVTPFDRQANKAVVYGTQDAIAVIAYTGMAYLGGMTTDDWLANQLDPQVRSPGGSGLFRTSARADRRNIGLAVMAMRRSLDEVLRQTSEAKRANGLTVQIVGFKWTRRRLFEMPFAWKVANTGQTGATTTIVRSHRYWGWERGGYATAVIGNLEGRPEADLAQRLSSTESLLADWVENAMVDICRLQSSRPGSGIGPHCMSVLLQLKEPEIRIRFLPADEDAGAPGFTPWVLLPAGAIAPAVVTGGGWSAQLGAVNIAIERLPPADASGYAGMDSQQRPPEP